ncbi:MAG: magnesium/cobalt transporter CorA [Candidatus Kuenenia sp.]|nr:magnesium/cobalt transporter CorA [Candidatus Kuenenia hertensis]
MPRLFKIRSKKAGLPPGSLVHIGEKKLEKVKISAIEYSEMYCHEREVSNIGECFPIKNDQTTTWITICGIHNVENIENVGKFANIHPLLLEDIMNTDHRPKIEDFEDYIFIVLKLLTFNETDKRIEAEQISLILGKNYVISFQEKESDVFNPVRERIKNGKGRVKKMGADYLAYTLLDAIVDGYFVVLEKQGEYIEAIEEELITNPSIETLKKIHTVRSEMLLLRKSVWPLRDVVNMMRKGEFPLVRSIIHVYLRDVYDHTIHIMDTIETFRDMATGMLDIYLSSVSNKMNEVMKVLTLIATIFIPLTFISGIYGMNFKYLPELDWRWGYFAVLTGMGIMGISMVVYFRKKKWI